MSGKRSDSLCWTAQRRSLLPCGGYPECSAGDDGLAVVQLVSLDMRRNLDFVNVLAVSGTCP